MSRIVYLALALLMSAALSSPVVAESEFDSEFEQDSPDEINRRIPLEVDPAIDEAKMAIRLKDYTRATEIWRRAATRGNAEAAYRLGVAYRSGLGVEKSNREAAKWFQVAADGGDKAAQFALGTFYQNGTVVEQNRDEAIRLFGLAARGGNRDAQKHLERIKSANPDAYAVADARVAANRLNPREALAQAIRIGDTGSVKEALARGAPINGAPGDEKHWRPLILAIDRGDADVVSLLLAKGADPNLRSRVGEPALFLAIRSENRKLVRSILSAGAQPNVLTVSGYTPLMEAARLGAAGLVDDLLAAGADPKLVLDDGTSAAGIARRFGNESLSRALRKRGAPIVVGADTSARREVLASRAARSQDTGPSLPPVVEAARRGDVDLLEEMVDQKINLAVSDSDGGNALTRAAEGGHVRAIEVLLSAGVDPDLPGVDGTTALMSAMASGAKKSDRVFEFLLESGADPHARTKSGRGAIDFATLGATKRKLELLQAAGGSWTSINLQNVLSEASAAGRLPTVAALLGVTTGPGERAGAICRATEQAHLEILDLLLSAESALESDCGEGRTPLTVAAHKGDVDVVRRLIQAGADPNGSVSDRDTALIAAAGRGHSAIVDLLIQEGAEIDRRGERRMTALMTAATSGHAKVVEALLNAGADRGMRNETKLTALDLAQQSADPESAELIESFRPGWRRLLGLAGE